MLLCKSTEVLKQLFICAVVIFGNMEGSEDGCEAVRSRPFNPICILKLALF
ncbi:Uncharacterised protein [Mycobacterium tuberculosis]|nr:Uncharacterised protein [Mycobacterium tuberculosis]